MAKGHATVYFGAFPGTTEARATIAGQTDILTTSDVEAWIRCETSADHSVDEHVIEDFSVHAHSLSAGNGFTVTMSPRVGRCYGLYNFSWVWQT